MGSTNYASLLIDKKQNEMKNIKKKTKGNFLTLKTVIELGDTQDDKSISSSNNFSISLLIYFVSAISLNKSFGLWVRL